MFHRRHFIIWLGKQKSICALNAVHSNKAVQILFFCYILLHIRFTRGANRTFKKKVSSVTWVRNCCLCDSFVLCSDTGATILAIMNDWFNLYFWVRRAFSLRISGFKPFVIRLLLGEKKESNMPGGIWVLHNERAGNMRALHSDDDCSR